ncbi:Histone deacetylase complex subunit [Saitoella coloradoensis]
MSSLSTLTTPPETLAPDAPIDEETEVTRCICGLADQRAEEELDLDPSQMIACEGCGVWQHCQCVGIADESLVEGKVYWCEECRPDLHRIVRSGRHKRSRYNLAAADIEQQAAVEAENKAAARASPREVRSPKDSMPQGRSHSPKRRSTMNSRDAGYEAAIQASLLEAERQERRNRGKKRGADDTEPFKSDGKRTRDDREDASRKRKNGRGDEDEEEFGMHDERQPKKKRKPPMERESIKLEAKKSHKKGAVKKKDDGHLSDGSDATIHSSRSKPVLTVTSTAAIVPAASPSHTKRRGGPGNRSKARNNVSSAVESSHESNEKLAKPRAVTGKMSMQEMRKRVAGIIEFIHRTQVEMAQEREDRKKLLEKARAQNGGKVVMELTEAEAGNADAVAAIESAGPLVKEEGGGAATQALAEVEEKRESLYMMDQLTRDLLMWEQRFGRVGDKL